MSELVANIVGSAAAVCSITSFAPQGVKIWKERDASAVSLKTYGLTVTCFVLWVVYGVMNRGLARDDRERLRPGHGVRRAVDEMALQGQRSPRSAILALTVAPERAASRGRDQYLGRTRTAARFHVLS